MPSEDDSAASDKGPHTHMHQALPSVGSQSVSNTQDSFASRTQTHTHTATYSLTQTASSMAPSIGTWIALHLN